MVSVALPSSSGRRTPTTAPAHPDARAQPCVDCAVPLVVLSALFPSHLRQEPRCFSFEGGAGPNFLTPFCSRKLAPKLGHTARGFTRPTANYVELAPTTPKTAAGVSNRTGDSVEQALRTGEVAASSPSKTIAASFCAELAVRAWSTIEFAEVYCLLATLLLNTAVACAVSSSRSGTVCGHGKCRLPPHVWSRCRLAPWPVLATLVSICSNRQAFCFWQETFRRLVNFNVSRRICKACDGLRFSFA